MNKFKVGDVVVCINNKNLYGVTPKLTVGKSYKVVDLNEETDIFVINDNGSKQTFSTIRFKLAEGENMYKINKEEAQAKINEIKKELAKLEEIVNIPDEPKFKPVTIEIDNAKAAYLIFDFLCTQTTSSGTYDIYSNLTDNFRSQLCSHFADSKDIKDWLKSQF